MTEGSPVKEATAPPAERLRLLELALTLASQKQGARLRLIEWVALGAAAVVVYLVFISPPTRAFRAADLLVLCFIAGAAGVLALYEWRQAVACQALLDALPMPEKAGTAIGQPAAPAEAPRAAPVAAAETEGR